MMVGAYSRCIFVEKYKNKEDTLVGTGTSGGCLGVLGKDIERPVAIWRDRATSLFFTL